LEEHPCSRPSCISLQRLNGRLKSANAGIWWLLEDHFAVTAQTLFALLRVAGDDQLWRLLAAVHKKALEHVVYGLHAARNYRSEVDM
jgi:hypothetical protein